jgi:hypothetical protein
MSKRGKTEEIDFLNDLTLGGGKDGDLSFHQRGSILYFQTRHETL